MGAVESSLAESWTIEDLANGDQTYTFKLRQGVAFHDGEAWNCAAAKLNFDHFFAAPLTAGCDYHEWYTRGSTIKFDQALQVSSSRQLPCYVCIQMRI